MSRGKDLLVPPFNKDDIELIATEVLEDKGDDVINQAIADGKIQIPAGGTKLYKHEIAVQSENDNTYSVLNGYITILNADLSPLNTIKKLITALYNKSTADSAPISDYCEPKKSYGPRYTALINLFHYNRLGAGINDTDLIFSVIDLSTLDAKQISVSSVSDTVTEL